jgi:hypothetical protein
MMIRRLHTLLTKKKPAGLWGPAGYFVGCDASLRLQHRGPRRLFRGDAAHDGDHKDADDTDAAHDETRQGAGGAGHWGKA